MMRFLSFTLVAHADKIKPFTEEIEEAQSPCDAPCLISKDNNKGLCSDDGNCGCGIDGCGEGEHQLLAELPYSGLPGVGYCRCHFVGDTRNHVFQDIDANHKRSHGLTVLEDDHAVYVPCNVSNADENCEGGVCKQMSGGQLSVEECTTTRNNEIGVTHMCKCKKKSEESTKFEARLI